MLGDGVQLHPRFALQWLAFIQKTHVPNCFFYFGNVICVVQYFFFLFFLFHKPPWSVSKLVQV